jgi:hypothetical protein
MAIVPPGAARVNSLDAKISSLDDLGPSRSDDHGPARPGILSRRVELRRTRADDGYEYLVILIREPLAASDVTRVQQFLDEIDTDPSSRWVYRPGHDG